MAALDQFEYMQMLQMPITLFPEWIVKQYDLM
jgi:hypothetical protein